MLFLIRTLRRHKLTLSFLLIILIFLSFGIITIRGLFTLGNLTRTIHKHPLVVSNASLIAALNITKMHRSMKDVVLSDSPDEMESVLKVVAQNENEVYKQLDIISKRILGKEGKNLEKQTRELFINWKPIRKEVVTLLETGNRTSAISVTKKKGADHVVKLETKMLELTSYARNKADTFLAMAEASQSKLENITAILTLAGILISIIIASITTYLVIKSANILQNKTDKLQKALDEIKTLHGILPICSHCKQIRDDKGSWKQIEEYIRANSEAEFTHGVCPSCIKKYYPKYYASISNSEK